MVTENQAAAVRVKRGARWLDENFAGWEKRIKIESLDLADGESCICGQVFKTKARQVAKKTANPDMDGFSFGWEHLFSQANSWISGIVKVEAVKKGEVHDEFRSRLVATALGFYDGSVDNDADDADGVYVDFNALQKSWIGLLKRRAKSAAAVVA